MNSQFDVLHKFVANNYDLEHLESILSEFNPLNVLKVDQYEIRHSNILAWLLNPKENHNLRELFLKKFLSEVVVNNDYIETQFNAFKAHEISYHDFEVYREWNNIDLLMVSRSNKLAIIIENKVHSKESNGQLNKYFKIVKSHYIDFDIIPIFLTLDGQDPSDNRYGIISYREVLHILKFVASIQKDILNPKVYDFISYYLKTLEILTMEDEEIKRLCKKIYKEHREALDLIYEYAEETEFEESARSFINSIKAKEIGIDGRWAWFLPKSLELTISKIGEESWCNGYPLAFWFVAQEEKLGLIIEVGPFVDQGVRKDFLIHLRENGFKISERSLSPTSKYTRIFSSYPYFNDWDDKDSLTTKMDELINKSAKDEIKKLEKACSDFDWALQKQHCKPVG